MTVTTSVVPRLTRADLLAIVDWTERQVAGNRAYEHHRDAIEALGTEAECLRCRTGWHQQCVGRAGKSRRHCCACWDADHPSAERTT